MIQIPDRVLAFYQLLEGLLSVQKNTAFGSDKKDVERKSEVHRFSELFIARSWKLMEPELMEGPWFGLSIDKSMEELSAYLREIEQRSSAFPWAWIRARATEAIMTRLSMMLPELSKSYSAEFDSYRKALHRAGIYWFRQSPKQHLEAGYHTALSGVWKVLGEEFYCLRDIRSWMPEDSLRVKKAMRSFATFHMEYLLASDGYLWDSAGATAYRWSGSQSSADEVSEVCNRVKVDALGLKEGRLGCPALRAKIGDITVFDGVWEWSLRLFREVYMPCFRDNMAVG